jgi:cyclopropane-fatty-acyl-phospholipid synthase
MALNLSSDAFFARVSTNILKRTKFGEITLTTPTGKSFTFKGTEPGPKVDLQISDWSVAGRAITRGDIGFGEDYIDGKWTTSNLPALLTFMTKNVEEMEDLFHGKWWSKVLFMLTNFFRTNTKKGSRKNIESHYDVGNEFYKLWLDETMTYSSALFDGKERSLKEAQDAKYRRILDKVEKEDAHILEIGCGWGGFAEAAAMNNKQVTGVTISKQQFTFAEERLRNKKLDNKAQVRMEDYRDIKGLFDYIVSIEMFEAVGERYWATYFKSVQERLKKDGKAIVQTITIHDDEFEGYRRRSDFIRHYTFPGGMLPSLKRFKEEAEKSGLTCREVYSFGKDYAKTLQIWLDQMHEKIEEIKAMGYSEQFIRSWSYYMSLCIAGFSTGRTEVVQVELVHT